MLPRDVRRLRAARLALVLSVAMLAASLLLVLSLPGSPAGAAPAETPTATADATAPAPTDTPSGGPKPTVTTAVSPTTSGITPTTGTKATPTATAGTASATATNDANSGGDGSYYPSNSGPQPTKVVFSRPTVGAGSGDGLGGLAGGGIGSSGLLIATIFSCLTGLLGIIIAAVSLSILIRGGYGPFLKALLRGQKGAKAQVAGATDAVQAAGRNDRTARNGRRNPDPKPPAYGRGNQGRSSRGGWDDSGEW